jgi:hypothetical protein
MMKRIVVTFGVISGVLPSLMMLLTVPFMDRIGFEYGHVFIEPFPVGLLVTLISAGVLRRNNGGATAAAGSLHARRL